MKNIPNISNAEWVVMKVIWEKGEATANDVIESLEDEVSWKPKTVMTMLKRLVDKGALRYEKQGRAFVYAALLDESECVRAESRSFLERVFGGSLKPMLANLIDDYELSDEEIEELKRILDQKNKPN